MATTSTRDRRRHERVTLATPVTLAAPTGALPAALCNLSVAGLRCTTARPLDEMTRLQITLDLPPLPNESLVGVRLEISGAVVRCTPLRHGTGKRRFDVAIYFLDLTDAARVTLADFVKRRLELHDEPDER